MRNCIICNTQFKPFVHNQERCRTCVDDRIKSEGSYNKLTTRKLEKPCKWCGKMFKLTGPASYYCSEQCNKDLKRANKYNLSKQEYDTLTSKTVCDICNEDGFKMNSNYDSGLVIDHCHSTGKVRGMLCHNCNRAAGLLQDDIDRIKRLIEYLEGATTILKGSTGKSSEAHNTDNSDDIV